MSVDDYSTELQDYVGREQQICILVADQSKAVRKAVRSLLEVINIRVFESATGKDTMQQVRQHQPHLVIVDAQMPDMPGSLLLRTLRNVYTKTQLPVVLITADDSAAEVVKALDMGVNDYVIKPLDLDILWARVSNQLMQKFAADYMDKARGQLEDEVQQRTAELHAVNNRLATEIKQRGLLLQKLKKRANYDALTGLPNRLLAADRLRQVISKAQRQHRFPCVAFLDLDNFKSVNDTLGHAAGDELLREAAKRLRACARKSDTVARLGGDEFLLILDDDGNETEQDREHAISRAGDRILQQFAAPFELGGKAVAVSPSIGFAIYGKDGTDSKTLTQHADIAMYRSKKEGRNTYSFYSPEMMAKHRTRHFVELHLQQAFEHGELDILYQPVIDLLSGKLVAVEASLRWQHSEHGSIPPDVFLAVAEDIGLMVPIGSWMLGKASRQLRELQQRGNAAVSLSLNITAAQLQAPGFVDQVRQVINGQQLPVGSLCFELDQSLLQGSPDRDAIVTELQALGVDLVLDNFDGGRATLEHLCKYRFAEIKPGMAYIEQLMQQAHGQEVFRALVAYAAVLDMRIVATGVNDSEQLEFLRTAGCFAVQGAITGEPVAASALERYLPPAASEPRRPERHLELVSSKGANTKS